MCVNFRLNSICIRLFSDFLPYSSLTTCFRLKWLQSGSKENGVAFLIMSGFGVLILSLKGGTGPEIFMCPFRSVLQ